MVDLQQKKITSEMLFVDVFIDYFINSLKTQDKTEQKQDRPWDLFQPG